MTWFIMGILSFFRASLGLNERKLLRILRVRSRARIDGRRDLPATEETRLSTTEEAIMAAFQNSESQLQQLWSTRCRQHAQSMEQHAFSAKESDYDTPVARAKVTLAKAKQDLRDRMVQARVRERDLLGALRAFQTQHELERDAKYPEVPLLALSLLIALALIEALLMYPIGDCSGEPQLLWACRYRTYLGVPSLAFLGSEARCISTLRSRC